MKTTLSLMALMAMAAVSLPASANSAPVAPATLQQTYADGAVLILARHGADDPIGHDRYDDKGGKKSGGKHRGGHDDGPNHA